MAITKWAKYTNEATREVAVGLGTDTDFYKNQGFSLMEVEEAYNGVWYEAGYAPQKPEPTKEEKIATLQKKLKVLDEKSSRSMRAILAETATQEDREYLANIEAQAEALRREMHELEVGEQ